MSRRNEHPATTTIKVEMCAVRTISARSFTRGTNSERQEYSLCGLKDVPGFRAFAKCVQVKSSQPRFESQVNKCPHRRPLESRHKRIEIVGEHSNTTGRSSSSIRKLAVPWSKKTQNGGSLTSQYESKHGLNREPHPRFFKSLVK